jgi:hypothetical protein
MSLQKKLEKAEETGLIQGVASATEWCLNIFEEVINNTQGIGPKKKSAILSEIQKKAKEFRR